MYDRGNVLVIAQMPGPGTWGLSIRLGARVSLLDTGSGHLLLTCQSDVRRAQMLAEHITVEGEVPIPADELEHTLQRTRAQGYKQRDSLQLFGVVDISCAILEPDGHARAVLTSPYIRRIDRHVGPSLDKARALLIRAAQGLPLNQQQRDDD